MFHFWIILTFHLSSVSYYDGTEEHATTSFQQPRNPVGNTPAYSSFSALSSQKRPLLQGIVFVFLSVNSSVVCMALTLSGLLAKNYGRLYQEIIIGDF